ncbi:MAG TPA: hypothetical protein VE130_16450, partial [Nitrososphaeraceae archaeon]|nr:hypothetical protein [Nitrososphaeraceae archaeon]
MSYDEEICGKKFPEGKKYHLDSTPSPSYTDALVNYIERVSEHPVCCNLAGIISIVIRHTYF